MRGVTATASKSPIDFCSLHLLAAVLRTFTNTPATLASPCRDLALLGAFIRANGSVSGAAVSCQREIGSACSMAAAFALLTDGQRRVGFDDVATVMYSTGGDLQSAGFR